MVGTLLEIGCELKFVSHMSKSTENTHTHIPTLLYHYTTTTYFT